VSIFAQAHTWLSDDMLKDEQIVLAEDGLPGDRLGDGLLLPAPLRRYLPVGEQKAAIASWAPGLPETLAATRGMA
jgi:hypothetical protein